MKKIFVFVVIIFLPLFVLGQTIHTLPSVGIETTLKRLADILFYLLILSSIIFILVGGITIATSAGDPNRTELGKKIIIFSLVGLMIGTLAFGIVNLFYGYLGLRR